MCNCPGGVSDSQPEPATPKNNCQNPPQDPNVEQQRELRCCCKAKRKLTYEDQIATPSPCTKAPSISPPSPCPPRKTPMRPCDLAGVAIVRRRVACDSSTNAGSKQKTATDPSKVNGYKNKENDKKCEKDEDSTIQLTNDQESAEKDGDEEKENESASKGEEHQPAMETPKEEQSEDKSKETRTQSMVTSTPCPGKLQPNKECNC